MNKEERKLLSRILEDLQGMNMGLEELKGDLETKAQNVEEYFPGTCRAERLSLESEKLDEAFGNLDEAIRNIEEVLE